MNEENEENITGKPEPKEVWETFWAGREEELDFLLTNLKEI